MSAERLVTRFQGLATAAQRVFSKWERKGYRPCPRCEQAGYVAGEELCCTCAGRGWLRLPTSQDSLLRFVDGWEFCTWGLDLPRVQRDRLLVIGLLEDVPGHPGYVQASPAGRRWIETVSTCG